MKTKLLTLIVISMAVATTSCMQSPNGEKVQSGEASEISFPKNATVHKVDLNNSKIEWLGVKPTGEHFGTLAIELGTLYVEDGKLLGGDFTMDMNSITVLDIEDPEMKEKLMSHLKSADFFHVDSFPKATFRFNTVIPIENNETNAELGNQTYRIEGNLALRGVTKKISFPANFTLTESGIKAQTQQFVINRTEWNVNYGSKSIFANLKDNFINDEMGIRITLQTE